MQGQTSQGSLLYVTSVLLVVGALYVLSFGPACWLVDCLDQGADLLPTIYGPILRVTTPMSGCPEGEDWASAVSIVRTGPWRDGILAWYSEQFRCPRYWITYHEEYRPSTTGEPTLVDRSWEWVREPRSKSMMIFESASAESTSPVIDLQQK